jgi:virginiamycin B lyase
VCNDRVAAFSVPLMRENLGGYKMIFTKFVQPSCGAFHRLAPLLVWLAFGATANAASLSVSGAVTGNDGLPAPAALVSATEVSSGIVTTVFTDVQGRYQLPLSRQGQYQVAAQAGSFAAQALSIELGASLVKAPTLALMPDPDYLTRIPSDIWLSLLPDGEMKREFILNCTSCHEVGAARVLVDGKARTSEQWAAAFAAMRALDQYELLPPDFDDAAYVAWLTGHLTPERIAALQPRLPQQHERLAQVLITEYPLPEDQELPHDLVVGPHGRIWITAFFGDVIWALQPATGVYETYVIRPAGAESWGQARALAFDSQGTLWILLGGTHELVQLDTRTRAFSTHDIGMYAHSLALDAAGRIWFNDYFAREERIGVFDPATSSVRHIPIPTAGLSKAEGMPLPYGLQIDSVGRLYSTQLAGNTVVQYDTRSDEAKMFTMPSPNAGPRRPAVGRDDMLWIPEWNTGKLTRFDPATSTFKSYALGTTPLGGYDTELDPRSGEVWMTGALSASMLLFNPADGQTLEIPLPTNPAYTRHLAVDPANGDLWSAYSSLPAAAPRVVRIQRRESAGGGLAVAPR